MTNRIVAYFSASNVTKNVAEKIANRNQIEDLQGEEKLKGATVEGEMVLKQEGREQVVLRERGLQFLKRGERAR